AGALGGLDRLLGLFFQPFLLFLLEFLFPLFPEDGRLPLALLFPFRLLGLGQQFPLSRLLLFPGLGPLLGPVAARLFFLAAHRAEDQQAAGDQQYELVPSHGSSFTSSVSLHPLDPSYPARGAFARGFLSSPRSRPRLPVREPGREPLPRRYCPPP